MRCVSITKAVNHTEAKTNTAAPLPSGRCIASSCYHICVSSYLCVIWRHLLQLESKAEPETICLTIKQPSCSASSDSAASILNLRTSNRNMRIFDQAFINDPPITENSHERSHGKWLTVIIILILIFYAAITSCHGLQYAVVNAATTFGPEATPEVFEPRIASSAVQCTQFLKMR